MYARQYIQLLSEVLLSQRSAYRRYKHIGGIVVHYLSHNISINKTGVSVTERRL